MEDLNYESNNHCEDEVMPNLGLRHSEVSDGKSNGEARVNEELGLENIVDEEQLSDFASAKTIKVSGDNLTLYVDLSAPMVEDCEEDSRNFEVGDVVWIETKKQTWWPGKICALSEAPDNRVMVEYLGSSHGNWCFPSHLKLFHKIFHEVATKTRSRSYLGALEKALDEFGSLLRAEMACSCLLHEPKKPSFIGRFDEFSISNLNPTNLLSQIRESAKVSLTRSAIELTTINARLSVFYKFLGHPQLSMHELEEREVGFDLDKENPDGFLENVSNKRRRRKKLHREVDRSEDVIDNEEDEKTATLPDSRERKKSKYLSFPFVHFGRCKSFEDVEESPSLSEVKRGNKMGMSSASLSSVCVREFLCDLLNAAIDCSHAGERECFDDVDWFFTEFRKFVYRAKEEDEIMDIPDLNDSSAVGKECELQEELTIGIEDLF